MAIDATVATSRLRNYPHLDDLQGSAYLVARLLYDQVYRLQDRLDAAEATITTLVAAVNTQETGLAEVEISTQAVLAVEQQP